MLWVKALHIISVVCWFAVLFYLPRLFVYHAMTDNPAIKEQFKIMERRLYRGIGIPSMVATLVFGIWATSYNWSYYMHSGWFHIKMTLVVTLVIYHHMCGALLKQFARDECTKSHVFFRWFNEYPTLVLVACVLLVVLKQPG
ncbi:putative membrane protein [Teredinibacter turnerae T7901]|uniref:Protoporphyrinogen IX oxidase n=1 Tax=Teredinibacter turnerae (strain ATCC 39867 / T7901) TaxID=377629 RepID=C5BP51_TERTT|nr:protoporphyrinogen oxidase HemJ [Teredinibacter turnerae]ACR13457.1 putative membrane protein [Teredinibacter turnerae T7901]